jgi:hypothetical protein
MRSHLLIVLAAASMMSLAACSAETATQADNTADELRSEHVKVLAKDRAYPGEMVFAEGKLYWSEAHFVASGDPELDQQFAYWTGEFFSFNVSRSHDPKQVTQFGSPLRAMQVIDGTAYMTTAGAVTRAPLAQLDTPDSWKAVYQDYDHFEIDENVDVTASAIDGGRIYVTRTSGDLASVKLDGSDFKKLLKSGSYAGDLAVSGGTAFWTSSSDDPNTRTLWKANVAASRPEAIKVGQVREISSMVATSNGVLYALPNKPGQPGAIMRLGSNGSPEVAVPGIEWVNKIVVDGDALLFTAKIGSAEGLFRIPQAELGANAQPKKLYTLTRASDILPTADAVFVTSTGLDGRNRYDGSVIRIDRAGLR